MTTFVFYDGGTRHELASVNASTLAQATFKLGLRKGHGWVRDAIESGRIYHEIKKITTTKKAAAKYSHEAIQAMWWNK